MKTNPHRDTEQMSNGEKEELREGAIDASEGTDDVPTLATLIRTIPEAAEIALKKGVGEKCMFHFARALKAFEVTTGTKLRKPDLSNALSVWWPEAMPKLPADAIFSEYLLLLEDAFERAKSPLGANHFEEALRLARLGPLRPEARRYDSARLQLLVTMCYHLQQMAGGSPFFLSVRAAAIVLEITDYNRANAMLKGLVRDGVLKVVEQGKPGGRRATRYKFIASGANPAAPAA
jgi:hypothetical protein